jgi:hypothetical protein
MTTMFSPQHVGSPIVAIAFNTCAECRGEQAHCMSCGGRELHAAIVSTAECRGVYWAQDLARAGWRGPFPSWEASPRVRAIARRRVSDLARREWDVAALARLCARAAAARWAELATKRR